MKKLLVAALLTVSMVAGFSNTTQAAVINNEMQISADATEAARKMAEVMYENSRKVMERKEMASKEAQATETTQAQTNKSTSTITMDAYVDLYSLYSATPVRTSPTDSADVITTLAYGDKITTNQVANATDTTCWFVVNINGTTGYVWCKDLTTEDVAAQAEAAGDILCGSGEYFTCPEMLERVNADRANNGAGALVWDDSLAQLAVSRLPVMVENDKAGISLHTGKPDYVAENAACGAIWSSEEANQGWINSSAHHANRCNGSYVKYAAAAYQDPSTGSVYWVEIFE